jgi:hypothetical protein
MRARRHPILVAFSSLSILTERRLCNIAHVNERERPLWVKSGNAHNEPMMSAFHPIATKQRTQFDVGFVPETDMTKPALRKRTDIIRTRPR